MQRGPFTPKRRAVLRLLRDIRLERGLLQQEVADRLGVAQTYISRSGQGELLLDFAELVDFCEAVGVTLEEFARRYREALLREVSEDGSPSGLG